MIPLAGWMFGFGHWCSGAPGRKKSHFQSRQRWWSPIQLGGKKNWQNTWKEWMFWSWEALIPETGEWTFSKCVPTSCFPCVQWQSARFLSLSPVWCLLFTFPSEVIQCYHLTVSELLSCAMVPRHFLIMRYQLIFVKDVRSWIETPSDSIWSSVTTRLSSPDFLSWRSWCWTTCWSQWALFLCWRFAFGRGLRSAETFGFLQNVSMKNRDQRSSFVYSSWLEVIIFLPGYIQRKIPLASSALQPPLLTLAARKTAVVLFSVGTNASMLTATSDQL